MSKKTLKRTTVTLAIALTVWIGLIAATIWSFDACVSESGIDRVVLARHDKADDIKRMFERAHVEYPPKRVLLRNFKSEKQLELWASGTDDGKYTRIKTYDVCRVPGQLGPKREQGDYQVPEGVYYIDRYNPRSSFHLSLGINYPNLSDRALGNREDLGGEIFIHGGCSTVGCVPIGDDSIEELYLVSLDSKLAGGNATEIHMFPCRFDTESCRAELKEKSRDDENLKLFWQDLQNIHDQFNKRRRPADVWVNSEGRYLTDGKDGVSS